MIHTHIHRNQLGSISEKIYYWGDECILCHSFYSFLIFEPFFFFIPMLKTIAADIGAQCMENEKKNEKTGYKTLIFNTEHVNAHQ